MKEALLHHIWKFKRFDHTQLRVNNGASLKIVHYGIHNFGGGPDFLNARIIIGDTLWVGHVELHIKSSEWYQHKHHLDAAYNNVILHVVMQDNKECYNKNGELIHTLALGKRIEQEVLLRYSKVFEENITIPCASQIHQLESLNLNFYLDRLLIERLERKSRRVQKLLQQCKGHWEETLYRLMFEYFGFKSNGESMKTLAEKAPYPLLLKVRSSFLKSLAIVLGQSGLIKRLKSNQLDLFLREYEHLRRKFSLQPMAEVSWKYSRMRPAGFPERRITQLVRLFCQQPRLFNTLIQELKIDYWRKIIFDACLPTEEQHDIREIGGLGRNMVDILIINVILPLLFTYYNSLGNNIALETLIDVFQSLKPEKNKVIKVWNELGIKPESAAESQALLELKTQYCENFKCLNCQIGTKLLLE